MAYAKTEHSRKLRIKTANEWNKKRLEAGIVKRITMQFATEDANELDAIAQELGLSRPQAIKKLCEIYRESNK
ncbi:hypothetical protein JFL52_07510 [Histophilus somni]|nr:hypothetical protein JFL52_07510 [Histophilus somni]